MSVSNLSKSEKRRKDILHLLKDRGRISIQDVIDTFTISEATARRDLDTLSSHAGVVRTIGGAQFEGYSASKEPTFSEKKQVFWNEKELIAEKAVSLIDEGDVIGLTGGTTTFLIARALKGRSNITVVTNAVNIAMELADASGIQVVLTGGVMRSNSYELCGPLAEKTVEGLNIGKMFLGINGVSLEQGFTTYSELEAEISRQLIKRSSFTVAVFDHTKVNRSSLFPVCNLTAVQACVTNAELTESYKSFLQQHQIQLYISDKAGFG